MRITYYTYKFRPIEIAEPIFYKLKEVYTESPTYTFFPKDPVIESFPIIGMRNTLILNIILILISYWLSFSEFSSIQITNGFYVGDFRLIILGFIGLSFLFWLTEILSLPNYLIYKSTYKSYYEKIKKQVMVSTNYYEFLKLKNEN